MDPRFAGDIFSDEWDRVGGQGINDPPSKFRRQGGPEQVSIESGKTWSKSFPADAVKENLEDSAREAGYVGAGRQVINALTNGSLNFKDDTGSIGVYPGGFSVRSKNGWGVNVDVPSQSANVNVGNVNIQGGFGANPNVKIGLQFPAPSVDQGGGNQMVNPSHQLDQQLRQYEPRQKAKAVDTGWQLRDELESRRSNQGLLEKLIGRGLI